MFNKYIRSFTQGRLVALFVLLCALSACSDSGVEVQSTFANTKDIKQGAAVYFNEEVIGEVSDVVSLANGSRVAITLNGTQLDKLSSNSAIVVNRLKEGAPLEFYNRNADNDKPIVAGQEIRGLDSMFQLGAWMVGDAIQLGVGSISSYVDAFQEYLKSDEFQTDKENMQVSINGASVSAAEAVETVGRDLNRAIQELVESEDEIVAAVEQLGDELSPVVEEMSRSGSKLAVELDRFAEGLESSNQTEQQSGQRLLDSLIAMLEKLNDSMEQGAAQEKSAEPDDSDIK